MDNLNNKPSYSSEIVKKVNNQIEEKKEELKTEQKAEEKDPEICIRKYKKAVRRIEKLKKLYKKFMNEKETNKECTCCYCCYCIALFLAYLIVVLTDFILPIDFNYDDDFYSDSPKEYEKEKDIFSLILGVILSVFICGLCCSYTLVTVYSTKRMTYITGDFLSDIKVKISDSISLMKTVQVVCGFSFALVYCNLYFWKAIDKKEVLGKPKFYDEIIIPDYTIKQGLSVFMIIKIIIIIISIIGCCKFSDKFSFKNDLAAYNLSKNDDTINKEFEECKNKTKIINILE